MVCPYDNSEPPCGWTVDVLNVVRGMGRWEFTLADVYAEEAALARLHP
jgi:hypothetical protein